jgi:AcrR family transcriptional regulator
MRQSKSPRRSCAGRSATARAGAMAGKARHDATCKWKDAMSVVPLSRRTPPSPRRRSAEIIGAVARVFAERGFHGASTQDIADVLGIRQASLYYYFPSKEAALELVCLRGVEGFFETASEIAASQLTATEKLRRLIAAHLSPLVDRGDYMRVFLNERQYLSRESRRRIGKQSHRLEKVFETVLKDGIARGEFRRDLDPRLTTLAVLGMANAAPSWYGKEPNAPIERIIEAFTAIALAGVVARSAPAPRRGSRRSLHGDL